MDADFASVVVSRTVGWLFQVCCRIEDDKVGESASVFVEECMVGYFMLVVVAKTAQLAISSY